MDNKNTLITNAASYINGSLESKLDAWRESALNTLLLVAVIVFTPAIIVWLFRFNSLKEILDVAWAYFLIYVLTLGLAFFRQINYRLRAWALILFTYLTGTLALVLGGLAGDGRVYLLVLPVMALILLSARSGAIMAGLSVVTYSVLGLAAARGWLVGQLLFLDNPLDGATWVQEGIVLAACLAMVAALQWSFSQFLESMASKNARLYEQIRRIVTELEQRVEERTAELKHAYNTLRSREKNLAAAQRIGQIGSWEWKIDTNVERWSEEAYRIVGISPDEFRGDHAHFSDLLHPDDRGKVNRAIYAALKGECPYDLEYRFSLLDQSTRHVHARAEVIYDDDGEPLSMQGTIHDITERVCAEENLRAAKAEAERANNAKSEFLSRMSHELRAPMNLVLGFAQLLEMDRQNPLTPSQRKSVRYILDEGAYLLRLIDEVLDISRIETGRMAISPETVDVSAVVNELHNLCEPLAARNQVQIVLDESIQERIFVRADQQRLHQVLLNLISNAIKFNVVGGRVSLSCQHRGRRKIRISVRDTGVGIQPEKLDKLFVPFVRLEDAGQNNVEGTGLGLALSRQLMELMNGDIGVKSVPSEGSEFWIELPLAAHPKAHLHSDAQPAEVEKPAPPASTLLYIEDYKPNLELLKMALSEYPQVKLLWASDGKSGLAMAREQRPDLILLDLQLPDMHGYDVLQQLAQDESTETIPVVVLSADATPRQIEYLVDAGALAYLTKPINMSAFLQNIQSWLP